MSYIIARVEDGIAYLWGESFALISADEGSDVTYENGWYYVIVSKSTFKDKKGVTRQYVTVVEKIDPSSVVACSELKRLLSIYYGTSEGLKDIVNNYNHLIPYRIRNDSRFHAFESVINLDFGYSSYLAKEYEMSNFVSKICSIVASRIIKDKFVKKETVED